MMDWFWKWLAVIIIVMLLVRCDIEASVYKADENNVLLEFPSFVVTPILWVEKRIGGEFKWGYNSPFADDYELEWNFKSSKPDEQEDKK